jgi:hypothetical protein
VTSAFGFPGSPEVRQKTKLPVFPGFDIDVDWNAQYELPELHGYSLISFSLCCHDIVCCYGIILRYCLGSYKLSDYYHNMRLYLYFFCKLFCKFTYSQLFVHYLPSDSHL